MNLLSNSDTSIVSDIPGTTRDVIRTKLQISGHTIEVIDTAGIRDQTQDAIERIGIDRAKMEAKQAHAIVVVIDVTDLEKIDQESGGIIYKFKENRG